MLAGIYDCFQHWGRQTVWVISDLHFGDAALRKNFPMRPDDDEIVRRINKCVGRKDTLIILGDVGDISYLAQLRGYKVLLLGNHDMGCSMYSDVVDEVYGGPLMIGEKLLLSHEPISVPWAYNIHGHQHNHKDADSNASLNVCCDVFGYSPLNLNRFLKKGGLAHIKPLHRATIDKATAARQKRGYKLSEKKEV